MREILFRGKRTDNGEWIYGDLMQNVDCIKIREQEKDVKHIAKSFEIDLETVGQYTDLADKNGKRIFEGDIVKTSDITHESVIQIPGESFEIAMRKGCWVMIAGEDWDFLETNHECIQVIGNIHGNQELLKGGEGL